MSWNRRISIAEHLMVDVLGQADKPLTLIEIVTKILQVNPSALTGKTPKNSLYSVLFRREKRRTEMGHQPLFKKTIRGNTACYSINPKGKKFIGERILKK